jgi:hypothetical protein
VVFAATVDGHQDPSALVHFHVRVFDQVTREPLQATVIVTSGSREDTHRRALEANELGSLLLQGIVYGPVWLVAHAPGYGRAVRYLFHDPSTPEDIELLLPRGASVHGSIVDRRGLPVSGASIKVRYRDNLLARLQETPSAAAIERATQEGFPVRIGVADWHRGCRYTSCASLGMADGEFSVLDLDPDRRFVLVVQHDVLGTLESRIFRLAPGERLDGVTLTYR